MTQIELRTSRHVDSERSKSCMYDITKIGKDILNDALDYLHLSDPGPYNLLVKKKDGSYRVVDLEAPFKNADPIDHSHMLVVKEKSAIKVSTDYNFTRTIMLNLTVPIFGILELIAEKLHFHCQSFQYSLYGYNSVGDITALDSSLCIAEQCQDYSRLLFRRRYFVVFVNEFEEFDDALHVYRDIRSHFLKASIQIPAHDKAIEAAFLMVYADSKSVNELKETIDNLTNIPDVDLKATYCPSRQKHVKKSTFKKDLIKKLANDEPVDRLNAMKQFIVLVRMFPGYGNEKYKGAVVDQTKGSKTKCNIYTGPRGIKVMDQGDSKELNNVHILKILSYSFHKKRITLKWQGPNGNKDVKSIILSVPKANQVFSMIKENMVMIEKHYNAMREKRLKRANGVGEEEKLELVAGQYSTLIAAEEAIDLFLKEMKEYDDIDLKKFGLKVVTTAEECKKGDKEKYVEIDELKEIYPENTEFGAMLFKYLPILTIKHMNGRTINKKLQIFEDDIISIRGSVHNLHIKDSILLLQTAIDYSKVVSLSFPKGDIKPLMEKSRLHLQNLHKMITESDKNGRGISEMSQIIVEQLNKIVEILPAIKTQVSDQIALFTPLQAADPDAMNQLPKGNLTICALLNALDELVDYTYQKRGDIFKCKEVNSLDKIFLPIGEVYQKLLKIAEDLIHGAENVKNEIDETMQIYKTLNKFVIDVFHSEHLNNEISMNLKAKIKNVQKLFSFIQICTLEKENQTVGIKLFPGTLTYMFQSMNALQDMEQTIRSLSKYDFALQNPNLTQKLNMYLDFVLKEQNTIFAYYKKLELFPSDEAIRVKSIQELHEIKFQMFQLFKEITPYQSIVNASEHFSIFFENLDNSLYTLTPDNCSPPRVDTCIRSLTAIINALIEKQIDQQWIDRLQDTLNKIKMHYSRLVESPTDGSVLQPLHELLLITLRYIQTIEKYLSIADHRTIPLIIELLAPTIIRSLGNPFIVDEFDKCEHIIKMNQMHHDIIQVINLFSTVFEWPNICVEAEVVDDLKKRVNVLQKLFVEFAQLRPSFMSNPYTYVLALPILRLLNHVKITEANMIAKTREIDNMNMSTAMRKCLCQSMLSVNAFLESVKQMNIRPYRKMPTDQSILEYRKSLINLVAFIKNIAIGAPPETAELLNIESAKFMKFIGDVSKESRQPSHKFDEIVIGIDSYLDGIFTRNNIPEFTNSRDASDKVEVLQSGNEKIIKGETPTTILLEKLLIEMIQNMTNFHKTLPNKAAKLPAKVRDILSVWDGDFQSLINNIQPIINNKSFSDETILIIRKTMLLTLRHCPILSFSPDDQNGPSSPENKDFYEMCYKTYYSLDDSVNLTRQFPELTLISLNWQKLEVSIAEEIQELGEVILEQFKELSDVFANQIIPHPIVRRSSRLTTLVRELHLFFHSNFEHLNRSKDKLESAIEQFCRDIQQTLNVIIDNVKLLHPVMSNDDLIESADSLAQNVALVIKRFDQHHMTQQSALIYIETVIPELKSMKSEFEKLLEDPIVSLNPTLTSFLNEVINIVKILPDDLSTMKPTQLQQHCDKLYEYLRDKIPQIQNFLDGIGIGGTVISVFKNLMKFTSLEHKKIFISASLMIKQQVIPINEIMQFFEENIDFAFNDPANQNPLSLSAAETLIGFFDKLASNSNALPFYINTSQKVLSPHISQGNPSVLYGCIRCLATTETNTKSCHKHLQDLLINASCNAATILEAMSEVLAKTPAVTIYHNQLLNLIQQTDTSTLTHLKTIPAVLMTYANMRQIQSLLPLLMSKDEKLNQLSTQFCEFVNEADLALSNDVMVSLDNLVYCLESQGINEDFVLTVAKLLQNSTRGVTFDMTTMSQLANLYIKFESENSSEIGRLATRFDKMEDAKDYMTTINQYKPILAQWMSPSSSSSQQLLETSLKSSISSLLIHLETCSLCLPNHASKLPLYFSLPRAEVDQVVNLVSAARNNGIEVSKYESTVQRINETKDKIDKACEQIFVEVAADKAKQSFGQLIPNLIESLKSFLTLVGPIELAVVDNSLEKERERQREEEEKRRREEEENARLERERRRHQEEEEQQEIDYFQLVLDIYNCINDRQVEKTTELIKTLRKCIQNKKVELYSLKEWSDNAEQSLITCQFQMIEKSKSTLVQFLTEKIKWQSTILKNNLSLANVNDTFIDQQRALNEIAIHYLDVTDKYSELMKLSKIAADTQALTVHSYKFFENFPIFLFFDLYQTSVQMWGSLLSLFENPTNIIIKRNFRSIARLHAGLSYLVEDASFSTTTATTASSSTTEMSAPKGEFQLAQFSFFSEVSILYMDTAMVISTFSASPIEEIFETMIKESLLPFSMHVKSIFTVGEKMLSLNTFQTANAKFAIKRQLVEQASIDFSKAAIHPKSLRSIIEACQILHSSLQSLCKVAKSMTDVTIQQPDSESVSKLPQRVALPLTNDDNGTFSEKKIDITAATEMLAKSSDTLQEMHEVVRKMLFDVSGVIKNAEIVEKIIQYLTIGLSFVSMTLTTSNTSTNISIQEDLANSASRIVSGLEMLNNSVKGRFLLKSNWVSDANRALNLVLEEVDNILSTGQKGVEYETEDQKKKDDAEKESRQKFDDAANPLRDSRKKLDEFLLSLNDKPETPNREWANEICKLGVSSINTHMKVIAHLREHNEEMLTNIENLTTTTFDIQRLLDDLLVRVNLIANCSINDVEKNSEDAAMLLKPIAESLNSSFSEKTPNGQILAGTIAEIVKGAEQLRRTAEEASKVKFERIEAAKKRKEMIEMRKKEAEERRKKAAEEEAAASTATCTRANHKTQEQLMKRLELESKVILARMAILHTKAKLDALD